MFNEENSVENFIRDLLKNIGWRFVPRSELNRAESDILVEENLVNALVRLNPPVAENQNRADEIIYKLRAIHWSSVKEFSCLRAIDFALEAGLKFWPIYMKSIPCSVSQSITTFDKRCGTEDNLPRFLT